MKLSKFVKRAKSESYCVVIHADDSGIWLGTRLALYNATELPYMEGKEQAGAVLDIDSKAWEKMLFDEKYTAHAGADFGMNLTETDPTEQEARRVPLEMFYKGMGLVGLMYGNGGELIFYDSALIAPIADVVKNSDYIQGIITVIMTIGSVVVPALLAGFESFSAGIGAVMSAIQGIFQGLITFITGVFSGSWSQAWEGIKQIFGSAFDGLVALCKTPLNAVIAIINKAISGINGLGLTIPEWVPILGGKSFSINIPALPMLAKGGFTDGVSIAGEAGTEAVISFQRGVRSDNINTWTQAGRMLGVSGEQAAVAAGVPYADGGGAVELATLDATQDNNAVELQEIDTGKPQPEQDGGGTPDGGGQVVFAPQITVQGNADRAVLESVLDDAQQRFELWYEQMMRRKARTAY